VLDTGQCPTIGYSSQSKPVDQAVGCEAQEAMETLHMSALDRARLGAVFQAVRQSDCSRWGLSPRRLSDHSDPRSG
jgi:hypothetical protein